MRRAGRSPRRPSSPRVFVPPSEGPPVDNDFENAKKLVEETIRKIGLDPSTCKASAGTEHQVAWTFKRGSAQILVMVTKRADEGVTYLRVASPVVTVPADAAKQAGFFRKLLELNAAGLANAAFGLMGERVVVVSERPTAGLDAVEVDQTVRHLAAVADTFDDRFEKDFGATKA